MKTNHTPGPWQAKEHFRNFTSNDVGHFILWRDTSKPGVYWKRLDDKKGSFSQADAKLIAAAPELLEALKEIAELESDDENQKFRLTRFQAAQVARAAIANATL